MRSRSRRRVLALLGLVVAAGCAGAPLGPAGLPPGPAPEEAEQVLPATSMMPLDVRVELAPREHPAVEVRIDEILSTPLMGDVEFRAAVDSWVRYWRETAAEAMPSFLGRMQIFGGMVDSALLAAELPASLRYLPFIESGYNPGAYSRARAVGMWQFMPATADGLGLEVTPLLDERRDPQRSTEAALDFLADLRAEFGSWFVALAAYNGGPNRMRRVLARYAADVPPSDSVFWALRRHFPRETREYLPKLLGAVAVAAHATEYGFEPSSTDPFLFDVVSVPDATSLDVIAKAAGVPQAVIERLNPQFVRGMTPPGRASRVRVPAGMGATFAAAYAAIPADERVTFVEHRVASGETLSHIALRYGIRVAELQAANPGVRARALRVGALLTVPVAPSTRRRS